MNLRGWLVRKKLTITIDEQVYEGLHAVIGRGNISQFIEDSVRPHVVDQDLEAAYRQMAQDEEREAEALEARTLIEVRASCLQMGWHSGFGRPKEALA
jgi:predicted CopG family antitoxin